MVSGPLAGSSSKYHDPALERDGVENYISEIGVVIPDWLGGEMGNETPFSFDGGSKCIK